MKKKRFDKYVKNYRQLEIKFDKKFKTIEKDNLKDKKNDVTASR